MMDITTIRSLQGRDDVRACWQQWQSHANNDLAQFELLCQLRSEVECPFITIVETDGQPRALLAGRLERTVFAPTIGYVSLARLAARILVVIPGGVVGMLDDEGANRSTRHLRSLLREGLADAVVFHHLPECSPLLKALQHDTAIWLSESAPRWSTHREMALPAEGGFLEQKLRAKHRSRIRKHEKELEASFPGRVVWRWMTNFDDIAGLCARLEEVAMTTYQRGLGAGFFDNEEYRQRFALFASRAQLRVQLLEIDGRVRAFWFGTVYQGIFHSSETGYDPALRDFEVGTLMFARMVDALAHDGVRRLDFGLGDALYKERFGDRSWRETSVWLFAPTAKGVAMLLLLKLSFLLDSAARRLVARAGLTDRLKTLWRRHRGKAGLTSADTGAASGDVATALPVNGARETR